MAEILKQTRSICSICGEIIPATYEVRDNKQVFYTRRCPTHGVVDTDLGYHAAFYRKSFDVEKVMMARYGDGGEMTDFQVRLAIWPPCFGNFRCGLSRLKHRMIDSRRIFATYGIATSNW